MLQPMNPDSITGRIIRIAAAKSAEIALVTVIRLINIPLFLATWDADLYGEWLVLSTLLVYFQMGNLGFAQTSANEMTMAVARGNRAAALRSYQSSALSLCVIGLGILALVFSVLWWCPLAQWFNVTRIDDGAIRRVMLLFVASVLVYFFIGLFLAAYRCEGRYHRGLLFVNLFVLLDFLGTIATLLAGGEQVHVAMVMLGARLIAALLMFVDLRRMAPWIRLGFSDASGAEVKRLLSPSLAFMAFPVGTALTDQGFVLAISHALTPTAVVAYTALRTMTNIAIRVYDLVKQAVYPELSMAFGQQNIPLLRRLHRLACQASLWIGLAIIVLLSTTGRWLFEFWTRGRLEYDSTMMLFLLFLLFLRSSWNTSFVVPASINRHQRLTVLYFGASLVGLLVGVVLLLWQSIYFGLLGLVLIDGVMVVAVLSVSLRIGEDTLKDFIWSILMPPSPNKILTLVVRR